MKRVSLLFVVSSAILYAIALLFPQYAAPLVFIFLIPLFYYLMATQDTKRPIFRIGFLWGLFFFSIALFGIFMLVLTRAQGPARVLGYLLPVIYFSLCSGAWFWCMERAFFINQPFLITFITFLYFVAMDRWLLFVVGVCCGYPFSYPLLPLIQYPALVQGATLVGLDALLYCLIVSSWAIARWGHEKKGRYFIFAGISGLPFALGPLLYLQENEPAHLQKIVFLYVEPEDEYPVEATGKITVGLQAVSEQYPQATTILMPESSFKFSLNSHLDTVKKWCEGMAQHCTLIIGSHRTESVKNDEKLHGSLFCIQQGRITHCYDKLNCLPFGETLFQPWNSIHWIKSAFLNKKKMFAPGEKKGSLISLDNDFKFFPLICYDLFCTNNDPCTEHKSFPSLTLANDDWFRLSSYFQHLLLLTAHRRALEWGRDGLYIAHSGGWWLGKRGKKVQLQQLQH